MAAFQKKADVLFAINVLSDNFFNNDKDKELEAYAATIEEYFRENDDETDANTDNEEGMHICCAIPW